MAFQKPDKDSHKVDYPEAYHRIGAWQIHKSPYSAFAVQCTVFTFRSKADVDALDAAIADPDNDEKPVKFGPINERQFRFTIEDFGGKDKLTMVETYKLLKTQEFFADATDV